MKIMICLAVLIVTSFGFSHAQWGTGVFINSVELSEAEMLELNYYGIYLSSGYYWFDPITGQFGVQSAPAWNPEVPYPYGSVQSEYGATFVEGDFSGFISPDGSVTCGPDGGCIY